ncbi:hypothetical protein [Nocardia aurantia]|uniref:Uncharacterized protein n=1 Tax=Nocardia aurantia TaxID=2585199 RepID=A0A7K0DTF4_9NOCA|nr:hypothetical protein [Nocardia aurantia]MQY29016.1 hypothetical protein [Nocardia aurantia]
MDSGYDTGVIGAQAEPLPVQQLITAGGTLGPMLELELPQWPDDMLPPDPPAFAVAHKEFEEADTSALLGTHPAGPGGSTPADIDEFDDPLLGATHPTGLGGPTPTDTVGPGDPHIARGDTPELLADAHDTIFPALNPLAGATHSTEQRRTVPHPPGAAHAAAAALGSAQPFGMPAAPGAAAPSFGSVPGGSAQPFDITSATIGAAQQFGTIPASVGTAAYNTTPAGLDAAHAATTSAVGATSSAAPAVAASHSAAGGASAAAATPAVAPALPPDPVGALLHGLALPAVPGADALLKPFLDLLSGFGTGVLGAVNPASIIGQGSQVIQAAMQVGAGAFKTVDQVWQGKSARSAQEAGQRAQAQGQDTSQRGLDISQLTEQAAGVIQRGNVQLTAIAQAFAAEATALAPVVFTPPGQATLITTATESLGQAVSIVNATRAELSGYTAQLAGVVQQLTGADAATLNDAAQAAAQNIGQPMLDEAQQILSGDNARTVGLGSDSLGSRLGTGDATVAAGYGGYNGAHPGSYGGLGSYGGGGYSGGVGGGGGGAHPGGPGGSVPGLRPAAGVSAVPFGPGMPGAPGQGAGGGGFLGAPGAAAQRDNEDQKSRTVQPYHSATGNSDLTGSLGETTPEVIGQTHQDEIIYEYENDRL